MSTYQTESVPILAYIRSKPRTMLAIKLHADTLKIGRLDAEECIYWLEGQRKVESFKNEDGFKTWRASGSNDNVPAVPQKASLIQELVAFHAEVPLDKLIVPGKSRRVSWARSVAMFLVREKMGYSFPETARIFGRFDHTSVIYAFRRVERLLKTDEATQQLVATVRRESSNGHGACCKECGRRYPTTQERGAA